MASSSTTAILELSASKAPIPTCSPNLMPFHIKYSGPAPISTYFRVKQVPNLDESADHSKFGSSVSTSDASLATNTSDSQTTLVAEDSTTAGSSNSAATLAPGSSSSALNDPKPGSHLSAAFRGRTVRGTKIDLPEGFAGIVLSRSDAQSPATAPVRAAKGTQRSTRPKRGASKKRAEVEDVDEEDVDMGDAAEPPSGPVRTLQASGTFSSFTLWSPDIPVDEGRDEYLRSLSEWTKIAAEIHHYED